MSEDIVIIDTPGINAGTRRNESHAEVTKHVLEQSADSAVVLVPASSAMTDTLINFLLQNIKSFLHRSVFVLTAMDQLDPKDRPELVRMVKLKIGEKLGLSDALVLESSAITMIPVKTIPTSMMTEGDWWHWQGQFVQIEANLKQVTLHQRGMIINERLVRLLQELVNELADDLDKKKTKLAEEEKLLRENSVGAIEEVMNTLFAQSKAKIARQQYAITSHISAKKSTYRSAAKLRIDEIINEAGWDVKNYDEKFAPKIKTMVEDQGAAYAKDLNRQLKLLRDCCESVCIDFIRQFELNYKAFPSLSVNLSVPSIPVSSIDVPSMPFSSSRRYVEQQNSKDDTGGGVGATIGGIFGFLVGGPVGAVIGAGLGGLGGTGMAGDSLEKRQSTLRSYAGSDNEEFFDEYHSELIMQLDRLVGNILYQLEHTANAHAKEYGAAVSRLIEEHRASERRLMREVEEVIADSGDLSRRKNHLENLGQKLLRS